MKRTIYFIFSTLLSTSAFTQISINGSDVNPSPGLTYTDNQTSYLAPGNAGANQTWDFSSLTSSGTMTSTISAATNNGANMLLDNGSSLSYYSYTASEQEIKEVNFNGTTISYSDGEKTLQFPLTYNTNYADNFRATFTSGGIYPAVRSGSNTLVMDGYGTLMLPNQTINDVIRVHFQQNYSDTIDIGSPYIINYSSDIYIWYKAGHKAPILSMVSFDADGTTSTYGLYTNTNNVSIEDLTNIDEVKILGNPFSNTLNFSINTKSTTHVECQLVDLSGSTVYSSVTSNLSQGNNMISIPTTSLMSGVYALKIISEGQALSKIVVKN